jgi:RHS repeat-associated protein
MHRIVREGARTGASWPRLRLLLLTLAVVFLPAACNPSTPPAATLDAPDCTMDAVPGLTAPPSPPQPLSGAGSVSTLAAAAGALPGGGRVTPAGEYTYRIPIEVPPGRAGMAPSLALVHSSRGKNGHLGVGWQIEGLSEISRCPRTFAVDGFSDGVRLDDHDALCLDGHPLVSIGPGKLDQCAGQEWRTEDDTFARIVSCGHGNAVMAFRVYSKDGRIHDYQPIQIPTASMGGAQPPGDSPPGGAVNFAWVLAADRDRAGNAIHYQYGQTIAPFGGNDPPAVEYYPAEIDYTFQETTSEAGQRSIHFDYLPAGSQRPDPSFSYVAGVRVNVTQRLETTADAEGNVVRAQYDRRGRRTRVDDPDTGYRTFTYDGFGDLVMSMVNGGTLTTWYTLDAIGRTLEVHGDTGEITTFAWDTAPNGLGRLAHTTSPDGTAQDFAYDGAGRLSAETWTVDGAPFRFDLHYDPAARLGQIDYPVVAGQPRFSITYDYNAAGALGDVADTTSLAPYWMAEERNEDDRLLLGALGNGVAQTRGYDDTTGRLTTVFDGTPSGSATALSLAYDYDEIGRVRHRTDAQAGRVEAFGYDGLDRLHTWDLAHWIALPGGQSATTTIHATSFGYSDLGNLETVEVDGALVERNKYGGIAGPHALTNNGEGEYVYDDRGRLTQGPGRSVAYTSFDLPRTVTTAAGVTSFEYDAAGARVKKTGPDGATTVTLAGLYERRAVGAKVEHVFYVPGSEGVVAQVSLDEASGASATEYLHLDALGSVGAVTDAGGQVLGRMYYAPFGERRDQDGNAVTSVAGDVPVGFTGQWHDDDLGLVDMKGRVYDPSLRRFLTPDPVVAAPLWGQSFNRYSYVLNDPVNLVDPTGFTAADPSDPNAPDYAQGCGVVDCGDFGYAGGGAVVSLPGQEGQSGFSAPKYTTGAPVLGSNRRPVSLPVGPTAPAASILGPPTPASLAVLGPPFGPLLGPGWVTISAPTTADAAAIGFGRWLERSVDHSVSYIVDTWGPSRSIQMLDAMEANATKGYKRDGVLGAVAGVVNTVNPLYGYGVIGTNFAMAAGKGDVAGMVENGMDVLATAVTFFIGGPEGTEGAAAEGPEATLELAREIAQAGPAPFWIRAVTVLETKEGPTLVAGGASDLSAAQKALARQLGLTVAEDMPGFHAEETALNAAGKLGLTPTKGVSSVVVCPGVCKPMILGYGGWVNGHYYGF